MRGKEHIVCDTRDSKGITPAYAGKSEQLVPIISSNKDHPRICGEKASFPSGCK